MKKVLVVTGFLLILCGFIFSLYVVSRMETEDRLLEAGEIVEDELTSGAELAQLIGVSVGLFALGGLAYFFGNLPVYDKLMCDYAQGPLDQILSASERVSLIDTDYIGDFEIESTSYSLHRTQSDIYVITDSDNYDIQYWKGNIHELKVLEAQYDN